MIDQAPSHHRRIREIGAAYGLHSVQLNLLCHTIAGHHLNDLAPHHARLVAHTLAELGEEKARDWARELEENRCPPSPPTN